MSKLITLSGNSYPDTLICVSLLRELVLSVGSPCVALFIASETSRFIALKRMKAF